MNQNEARSVPEFKGNKLRTTQNLQRWHSGAAPGIVLEPDLPIVDTHHHLYGSPSDANFYRLEELREDLDSGHRIVGTVYVEAYASGWLTSGPEALRPVGETQFVVNATRTPLYLRSGPCAVAAGVVSHADMTLGDDVVQVLEAHVAAGEGRLKGVRHRAATVDGPLGELTPERRAPGLLSDVRFRKGFAHLQAFKLSFDAWVYHTQLAEVVALADAFADTTIVLNHVGGPLGVMEYQSRSLQVKADWLAGLRELAARPNVRMKVGGMGLPVLGHGFEHRDYPPAAEEIARVFKPTIETCVELFGTERCMFESNFPVDRQSYGYSDLWNAFKLVTKSWSKEERDDLFHRTACNVYRLSLPTSA